MFVVSRKYPRYPDGVGDGYTPVTVELPFDRASKITLHRMTGKLTDHNIDAYRVKRERVSIDPAGFEGRLIVNQRTGADEKGMPPGEVYLYVFEGTNIGPAGRTLSLEQVLKLPVTFRTGR